jgi:transposase-like protein
MMTPATATKNPLGRPRVTGEQVRQLRSQGASWRKTAKALGIGTATAMRLVLLRTIESRPNIQETSSKSLGDSSSPG